MPDRTESGHGPYLALAVFCENVLEDKTGVLSLIHIIDRINISAGVDAPESMPPIPLQLKAVLSFKSGFCKGKYVITVKPISPSGKELPPAKFPILFEGDDRGANVIVNFGIQIQEEGLYWFEVLIEETIMTRMPLRVLYQQFAGGTSTTH